MSKLIFVTGGARSGKSRFAVEMAGQLADRVVFVATCTPEDDEMRSRFDEHRKNRPDHWKTVEEPGQVGSVLRSLGNTCQAVIVDCLTLFVSNLLLAEESKLRILAKIEDLVESAKTSSFVTIVVSNEVGSGIVPTSRLGRSFRDIAGAANQVVARGAGEVFLMVSGIPVQIKKSQQ